MLPLYGIGNTAVRYRGETASCVRQIITVHCEDSAELFIVRIMRNCSL